MTMIEKILKGWGKKTRVKIEKRNGRRVYVLRHPSGALAVIDKVPGDMESRKWAVWARQRDTDRREAGRLGWHYRRDA